MTRFPAALAILVACVAPDEQEGPEVYTDVTPSPDPADSDHTTSGNPPAGTSGGDEWLIRSYGCFTSEMLPIRAVHMFHYDPEGTGEIQVFCPTCSPDGEVHPIPSAYVVPLLYFVEEVGLEIVDDPALVVPGETTMFACDGTLRDPGVTLVLRAWSEPDRSGRFQCWALGERAEEYEVAEGCLVGS